jgi:hypothetical protein
MPCHPFSDTLSPCADIRDVSSPISIPRRHVLQISCRVPSKDPKGSGGLIVKPLSSDESPHREKSLAQEFRIISRCANSPPLGEFPADRGM